MTRSLLRTIAIAIPLVGTGAVSWAQQGPDMSRPRRGVDSMSIASVIAGVESPVGELWDELRDTTRDGVPALLRIYRTRNAIFGPHAETTWVRRDGLSLLARATHARIMSDSIGLARGTLRGWRDVQGKRQRVVRPDDPSLLDASLFDVFLRAAPLREGYSVEIRAYLSTEDSVAVLKARVTGSATIQQRDMKRADCWVVEMDFTGLPSTLWIDKESRALVRHVIVFSPTAAMHMRR